MSEGAFNPYRELREDELRSRIISLLTRAAEFEGLQARSAAQSMLQDYFYSAGERRHSLELRILDLLDSIDEELFHSRDTAPVQSLRSDGSLLAAQIRSQRSLRGLGDQEASATVSVSVPRELIDRLRAEADYMKQNSLGVVPKPPADVLKILEGAAKTQSVDTVREFGADREDSIYSAVAQERGHSERAPMSDQHEASSKSSKPETSDTREEEKIPVLEGMLVRGSVPDFDQTDDFLWAVHTVEKGVVELDGVTHPGLGMMVNLEDFWKNFEFAMDVVQPGPVLAAIRELAVQERRDRNAQLRDEIAGNLSTGASRVVEEVSKLSERYAPVGERFFKRAVSAAKNAVESVSAKVDEVNAPGAEQKDAPASSGDEPQPKGGQPRSEDDRILSEAFSGEDFGADGDREVDLQALREKLASTPKVRSTEPQDENELRERIAELVYAAQHPDRGSKWLTTVDGSPNVASYAAADALLSEFSGFLASSNGGKNSEAQAGAEHSPGDRTADENSEDPALRDFPLPVPPAESDLERLEYLQRSLVLNDFEHTGSRREDELAELLDLLPNALKEIDYLRDTEGEIQKSFMDTLERLRGAVSTSSVRRAWESYQEARDSRDLILESRQEERAKVRRLEAEIEEFKARPSSELPAKPSVEDLEAALEVVHESYDIFSDDEPGDLQREALQSAIHILNRPRREEAERLKREEALARGYDDEFQDSRGYRWLVNLETDSESGRRLLTVRPDDADGPSFSAEIQDSGFLSGDRIREIVEESTSRLEDDDRARDSAQKVVDEVERRRAEVEATRDNPAAVISYRPSAYGQKELGHVDTFLLSGVLMDVTLSSQEGTTLKLLELTPQDGDEPLFRKEICAAGFLSDEKLRRIVQDPDGWIGDKMEANDE